MQRLEKLRIQNEPVTERVQAFADISRSALYAASAYSAECEMSATACCGSLAGSFCIRKFHNNEIHAPIANPPNSAQEGTLYRSSKLHPGPSSSVGMWRRTDRHRHSLRLTRNVIISDGDLGARSEIEHSQKTQENVSDV